MFLKNLQEYFDINLAYIFHSVDINSLSVSSRNVFLHGYFVCSKILLNDSGNRRRLNCLALIIVGKAKRDYGLHGPLNSSSHLLPRIFLAYSDRGIAMSSLFIISEKKMCRSLTIAIAKTFHRKQFEDDRVPHALPRGYITPLRRICFR